MLAKLLARRLLAVLLSVPMLMAPGLLRAQALEAPLAAEAL